MSSKSRDRSSRDSDSSTCESILRNLQQAKDSDPVLFKIVQQQKWRKLLQILKRRKGRELCKERDETGLNLIGISLGFHAPPDVIRTILTIDPSQALATDNFGANCLHMACLNGSSIESVTLLIELFGSKLVTESFDNDDRTPLHHAVECICRDEVDMREGLSIVATLCTVKGGCKMIHHQDIHCDTPIDIVQLKMNDLSETDAHYHRLVMLTQILRKISFEIHKSQKFFWENNGYCKNSHHPLISSKPNGTTNSTGTRTTKGTESLSSTTNASTTTSQGQSIDVEKHVFSSFR